ncbi:MAG: DUF4328 domain-containing protein [Nonlabens sp.]|uniref:DUF4328 domain-containing protein n=1 Tax=Nonlabens sp. TaxID=1888209 RepID=UPI003EF687E1
MKLLRNNQDRKKVAVIAIYFAMAMDVINIIGVSINYYNLAGNDIPDFMGTMSYYLDILSGTAQLIVALIVGILFIMWFRRAYWNLHQLVKNLDHGEGWAAGAWFVPILSLFRPYNIMQELWKDTPQYLKMNNVEPSITEGQVSLGWWWAAYISYGIIENISGRLYWRSDDLGLYEAAIITDYIASGCSLVAGYLVIKIIEGYHQLEQQLQQIDNSTSVQDGTQSESFISYRS